MYMYNYAFREREREVRERERERERLLTLSVFIPCTAVSLCQGEGGVNQLGVPIFVTIVTQTHGHMTPSNEEDLA